MTSRAFLKVVAALLVAPWTFLFARHKQPSVNLGLHRIEGFHLFYGRHFAAELTPASQLGSRRIPGSSMVEIRHADYSLGWINLEDSRMADNSKLEVRLKEVGEQRNGRIFATVSVSGLASA